MRTQYSKEKKLNIFKNFANQHNDTYPMLTNLVWHLLFNQPDRDCACVPLSDGIGLVDAGTRGYTRAGLFSNDYKQNCDLADVINEKVLGVGEIVAAGMVAASMREGPVTVASIKAVLRTLVNIWSEYTGDIFAEKILGSSWKKNAKLDDYCVEKFRQFQNNTLSFINNADDSRLTLLAKTIIEEMTVNS